MHIIIGLLVVGIGFLVVWKADALVHTFGYMATAERWFGTFGGTRLVLKLIGTFAIFVGFVYITGQTEELFGFLFGWLIPDALG